MPVISEFCVSSLNSITVNFGTPESSSQILKWRANTSLNFWAPGGKYLVGQLFSYSCCFIFYLEANLILDSLNQPGWIKNWSPDYPWPVFLLYLPLLLGVFISHGTICHSFLVPFHPWVMFLWAKTFQISIDNSAVLGGGYGKQLWPSRSSFCSVRAASTKSLAGCEGAQMWGSDSVTALGLGTNGFHFPPPPSLYHTWSR